MRHLAVILVLAGLAVAAEPNIIDPNVTTQKRIELVIALDELGPARELLNKKIYTGDMNEILTQRVADINEVKQKAEFVKQQAIELMQGSGYNEKDSDHIKTIIETSRRTAIEIKGLGYVLDPNSPGGFKRPLEPKIKLDEPAYNSEVDVMKTNAEIKKAVEEMKNSAGWLPEPNDPNYLEEVVRMSEFEAIIWDICKDS